MHSGWITVLSTSFVQAAEITKGMLEEHGIASIVLNQQDRMYPQIGDVSVLVAPDDVIRAKHLIESSRSEEE